MPELEQLGNAMLLNSRPGALHEPLSGRVWDRPAIAERLHARVGAWRDVGLDPGDRVLFHFGNNLEFFVDLLAVWHLGGAVIPIDARLTPFEVENLARAAHARYSLWHGAVDERISHPMEALGLAIVGTGDQRGSPGLGPSRLQLDHDALILFTSGTTGDPKGVVHSHRTLRARWMGLEQALGVERFRRTLCLLPTHFGHGLICNALFPWLAGSDLYVLPPFRADTIARLGGLIDDHRITFMSSVPSMWRLALRVASPPAGGSLERIHCGSAPLSAHLWREIQEWAGTTDVANSYGITETGSWAAGLARGPAQPEDGLIGTGWGSVVKVFAESDASRPVADLTECEAGTEGFVWLNTPALMTGYFRRPDLTDAVVSDGWFFTGDVGVLDGSGALYLRGRVREEINKGGMKIHPGDIDGVAGEFDGVVDVCTFGVDDDLYGQDVAIALAVDDVGTLDRLYAFMETRLADHQMPRHWFVIDEIPRTSRGKINRSHVAEACAGLAETRVPNE